MLKGGDAAASHLSCYRERLSRFWFARVVRFATKVGSVVREGEDNMFKLTRSYRVFASILAIFLTLAVAGCGGSMPQAGRKR